MGDIVLNILGSASAKPTPTRNPSAQVLDVRGRLFLIDCGEAAQMQMVRMGISPLRIEAVFLTHLHGDHVFGMFGLLSTMGMLGRVKPLSIFAPAGFAEVLSFYRTHFSDGDAYQIDFVPVDVAGPEKIYDVGGVEVWAFPLKHRVPTFGFLFREKDKELNVYKEAIAKYDLTVEEIKSLKAGHDVVRHGGAEGCGTSVRHSGEAAGCGMQTGHSGEAGECGMQAGHSGEAAGSGMQAGHPGEAQIIRVEDATYEPARPRSYAYCSDTAPFPELAQWVRGVDLLYHEATFPKDMTELAAVVNHSTTVQAARCALDAGAGRLVVGHFSSRFNDVDFFLDEIRPIFPNSFLAYDGATFEI